jgi:hypothetical protein
MPALRISTWRGQKELLFFAFFEAIYIFHQAIILIPVMEIEPGTVLSYPYMDSGAIVFLQGLPTEIASGSILHVSPPSTRG